MWPGTAPPAQLRVTDFHTPTAPPSGTPSAPPGALGRVPKATGLKDADPSTSPQGQSPLPLTPGLLSALLFPEDPSPLATCLPRCDRARQSQTRSTKGRCGEKHVSWHVPFSAADGGWLCLGFSGSQTCRGLQHALATGCQHTQGRHCPAQCKAQPRSHGGEPKAHCGAGPLRGCRKQDFKGTRKAHTRKSPSCSSNQIWTVHRARGRREGVRKAWPRSTQSASHRLQVPVSTNDLVGASSKPTGTPRSGRGEEETLLGANTSTMTQQGLDAHSYKAAAPGCGSCEGPQRRNGHEAPLLFRFQFQPN